MYDIFNNVSKYLAELQKKKKEEEEVPTLGSNNPYANEVDLNNLAPAQKAQLNATKTQTKTQNENATLPTLSAEDRAGLKAELDKVTNVIVPSTSTEKPKEDDTTKGETETETATEISLADILKKLQAGYVQSDDVKNALAKWNAHLDTKPTEWNGGNYINQLNDVIGQINNRNPFSYDVNADALYQMYKDQYMTNGKIAMMDTMGQASAMTGGYGNSYANMVGNQAYQGYMQGLNETVPELYQLALNKYNAEGDALYDKASLYKTMYDQEYGEHIDDVNRWYTEGERLGDIYSKLADEDYSKYIDDYNKTLAEYNLMAGGADGTTGTPNPNEDNVTPTIPNEVYDRLSEIDNDNDIDSYLTDLANRGVITPQQSGELYNEYTIKPLMDRIWTMVNNGGANWIGIDRNGVVKDDRGREYKLIDLKNAIIKELHANNPDNLNSREIEAKARQYIIDLQNKLGISNRGTTSSEKK